MKRAAAAALWIACGHGASAPAESAPPARGPAASVSITARGVALSPTDADQQIAQPIARAIAGLDGVAHVSTTSAAHQVTVTAWLVAGADAEGVADRVEADAKRAVDPHVPLDFFREAVVHEGGEVTRVRASSGSLPASKVRYWLESNVVPGLRHDPAVVAIDLCGGSEHVIELDVDPAELAATGVTVGDVLSMATDAHLAPRGNVDGPRQDDTLATDDGGAAGLGELLVAYRNGAPVRLDDVAKVSDVGRFDPCALGADRRTPIADVYPRAGADTDALSLRLGPQLRYRPAGIDVHVSRAPIRFDVAIAGGADDHAARSLATTWRAALERAPDVIAVEPDAAALATGWSVDRTAVAKLGVDDRSLRAALEAIQGGANAGMLATSAGLMDVQIVAPDTGADSLHVRARDATTVPLSAITTRASGPGRVDRLDGAPAVIVRFEVAPGDDADAIASAAIARARAAAAPPAGLTITSWREP